MLIDAAAALGRRMRDAVADRAPIVGVIAFFQLVVLRHPFPNLGEVAVGMVCVVVGLALFVQGLESDLFPLGEAIAQALAKQGSAMALLAFAFCLGFGTTGLSRAVVVDAAGDPIGVVTLRDLVLTEAGMAPARTRGGGAGNGD